MAGIPFVNEQNIMQRLLAPCGDMNSSRDDVRLDIGGLISRLLLFDTYVLDSTRLLEIPHMVNLFGLGGFLDLLASGALEVTSSLRGFGVADSTPPGVPSSHPGTHFVGLIRHSDPKIETNINVAESLKRLDLTKRDRSRLDNAVRHILREISPDGKGRLGKQLERDLLRASDEVRIAVATALRRRFNIETGINDFDLMFRLEGPTKAWGVPAELGLEMYHHGTNLGGLYHLDLQQVHDAIDDAIIAVGSMENRIQMMEDLQAIAGFTGEDLPIFTGKLGVLYKAVSPDRKEDSFRRVLDIAGMPVVPLGAKDIHVDVDKLIKLRQSVEHRDFMALLSKSDAMTDKEIQDAVASFGARMSTLIHGSKAQVFRFLLISAIGLIPTLETAVAGVALGAIDTFLLKRLIPYSGPAAFVNRQYPSLFDT